MAVLVRGRRWATQIEVHVDMYNIWVFEALVMATEPLVQNPSDGPLASCVIPPNS